MLVACGAIWFAGEFALLDNEAVTQGELPTITQGQAMREDLPLI